MIKAIRTAAAVVVGLIFTATALAGSNSIESITERLKKTGSVCIQGEECAAASGVSASAASGPRSGEEISGSYCSACHSIGVLGAPKIGAAADWEPRLEKGFDAVLANAIGGLNAMPPRGTCGDCSDEEISAAIQFMSK